MCGRFVSSSPPEQISAYFGAEVAAPELPISYNVAPTDDIYGVVDTPSGRRLEVFHWGLVPVWAKDTKIGQRMINARAETLATNGAFKRAFEKYRCIIPADGFYEWQTLPGVGPKGKPDKQPMFIHRLDGEPLALAGLWSTWRDRAGGVEAPWLHSVTIITTQANTTMAPVHDRMPVILSASAWSTWLDRRNTDVDSLGTLLVPATDDLLTLQPVGPAVNNVRNNGPELISALDEAGLSKVTGDLPPATLF
jgi:putative SOS response-associated peptidase YedK